MAGKGVTLELEEKSRKNLEKNLAIIKREYPKKAWQMITKLLWDMRFLAQTKLKGDKHVVTSRLRNSLAVKTPEKTDGTPSIYTDDEGNSYDSDLTSFNPKNNEGGMGTNVTYADKIEYLYDSFIYWAAKHVNVNKRVTELKKELNEIKFVK